MVIEGFLEGRVKVWFDMNRNNLMTIALFRQAFLEEFYSTPVKVQFKNQWLSRRYRAKEGSMQASFFKQIRDAKYFDPPLSSYEINYSIIQQFSHKILIALETLNYSDTRIVGQILGQLDVTQIDAELEKNRDWRDNSNQQS